MALDWIKMRVNLPDEPEVGRLARLLKIDEDAVLGKLFRVWRLSDQHTADGHFAGLSTDWLDERMRCHGFADAMAKVGWLEIAEDGLRIPKFNRHNGKSAKSRAKEAQDKRRRRVRKMSGKCPEAEGTPSSSSSISSSSSSLHPKDTGSEKDIPYTDVERVRLRLEGGYDAAVADLLRQIGKWGPCTRRKSEELYLGFRAPKKDTFEAWVRYAELHGKPAFFAAAPNYAHPDEVPAEPGPMSRKEREQQAERATLARLCAEASAREAKGIPNVG